MIQTLIGKKIEQTQRFLSDGTRIPVTVIAVPKTSVTQVKTVEKDGYAAVQIGIGAKKKSTQSLLGHAKKANLTAASTVLREVRLSDEEAPAVGDTVSASDVFKTGDIIKVSGVGKGKGFQGGVRRHGFRGGPRTHGQSDRERAPGSIGQTTTPGRVYKGKRMAGHMGAGNASVTNLVVVSVNDEELLIKGLVPGTLNSTVYIEKTGELKNPIELYESPEEKVAREAKEAAEQEAATEQPTEAAASEEVKEESKGEVASQGVVKAEAGGASEEKTAEPKEVKSEEVQPVPAEESANSAEPNTDEEKGGK